MYHCLKIITPNLDPPYMGFRVRVRHELRPSLYVQRTVRCCGADDGNNADSDGV